MTAKRIILASQSLYRHAQLSQLGLNFDAVAPGVDESAEPGERPRDIVSRLASAKAAAVGAHFPDALVIGADQLAVLDGNTIGKPGGREENLCQLGRASGREMVFLTGLCVINTGTGRKQLDVVDVGVTFRKLTARQIESYVDRDKPFDCAGGFRSEGLGIGLFRRIRSEDPSALLGLPLIRLVEMLSSEGVDVLLEPGNIRQQ